jgi:thiamine monophosphate synthase
MQVFVIPKRLSAIGRLTDNADSRALEHGARGVAKFSAVINDQTAHTAARRNTQFSASQMSTTIAFPLAGTPNVGHKQ